jgi:hypothetical protein
MHRGWKAVELEGSTAWCKMAFVSYYLKISLKFMILKTLKNEKVAVHILYNINWV